MSTVPSQETIRFIAIWGSVALALGSLIGLTIIGFVGEIDRVVLIFLTLVNTNILCRDIFLLGSRWEPFRKFFAVEVEEKNEPKPLKSD